MFFTKRSVKCWSRVLADLVQSPSLEIFKTRLDKALKSSVWPQSRPCFEQ